MKITVGTDIVVDLSHADIIAIEHGYASVADWMRQMVHGQLEMIRRLADESAKALFDADPNMAVQPASQDERILAMSVHEGYKNKLARMQETQRAKDSHAALMRERAQRSN